MTTRDEYLKAHAEGAAEAFRDHFIAKESDGRWLMMRPKGGFWTEVVCLERGGLCVDGDIDVVVFRYGPKDPVARVGWMGRRKSAWDRYFMEKASIGMGGSRALIEEFRPDLAIEDLKELAATLRGDESWTPADMIEENILPLVHDGMTRDGLCGLMSERGLWEESEGVGVVPSTRMFFAHAALQRLCALLEERQAQDGGER